MAEKCNWVVKCSSRMHEALGLIPISMSKKKKKKIKKKIPKLPSLHSKTLSQKIKQNKTLLHCILLTGLTNFKLS
jgi:hypothetical protein